MTRNNLNHLHAFDPEIERTLHRLRRQNRTSGHDNDDSHSVLVHSSNSHSVVDFDNSSSVVVYRHKVVHCSSSLFHTLHI